MKETYICTGFTMGICMFTQEKLAYIRPHKGRRETGQVWSRISSEDLLGAKSFNKSCPQPLLQCSQYRLALDMNYLSLTYATLNQQQEQNTCVEGFFPWISFLVFSFWTLSLCPFWVYLFPYCVPYFPTASVMILSSQEFTFLGLKNN